MIRSAFFAFTALSLTGLFISWDSACAQVQALSQQRSGLREITVDASVTKGKLKSLRGLNSGPLPWSDKAAVDQTGGDVEVSDRTGFRSLGADASEGYRRANIDLVRLHDNYGPGDIYANFTGIRQMADGSTISAQELNARVMFPNLHAKSDLAVSYNFGPTDHLLASINDIGAHPLFRLGASAGENSGVPNSFSGQEDYDHYADIVRHIVLHYNKGWNKGFHYSIKYWEVLNEPDGRFTPEKYYALYQKLAESVKAADPNALIGGPALMFANNGPEYRDNFLDYLHKNSIPMDFWTFHDYSVDAADPYAFVSLAQNMRQLLDSHGFQQTQIFLDEWNVLGIKPELLTKAGRAAFTASAIIYMQDSAIDAQTFYMGPNLFGEDGKSPDKVGQALIAIGQMKNTPLRLAVIGGDTQGLAILAGKSNNGHEMNVLISNYEIPLSLRGPRKGGNVVAGYINLLPRRDVSYQSNDGFNLRMKGLIPEQTYQVERYKIDDNWDYRLLSTTLVKGEKLLLSDKLSAPAIELISIKVVNNRGNDK